MPKKITSTIDIIIPSFNGKNLLAKHLPSVIKYSAMVSQIIVIDDGSSDDTKSFLSQHFPQVRCIHHSRNIGFTQSINQGVKTSTADFIVLLNNDVEVTPGYLDNVLQYFKDDSVFGVSFNETTSSWPLAKWSKGKFQFVTSDSKDQPYYSAWVSGGSSIIRRSIWNKVGGFNPSFSPGYWEDIDVSVRAWRMGYRCVWDPFSKVLHQHESSFSKFNPYRINLIKQRNELLFIWSNFTSLKYRLDNLKFIFNYILFHPGYLVVFLSALKKFTFSKKFSKKFKYSEDSFLTTINQPL